LGGRIYTDTLTITYSGQDNLNIPELGINSIDVYGMNIGDFDSSYYMDPSINQTFNLTKFMSNPTPTINNNSTVLYESNPNNSNNTDISNNGNNSHNTTFTNSPINITQNITIELKNPIPFSENWIIDHINQKDKDHIMVSRHKFTELLEEILKNEANLNVLHPLLFTNSPVTS
jgi:hypothetical protein